MSRATPRRKLTNSLSADPQSARPVTLPGNPSLEPPISQHGNVGMCCVRPPTAQRQRLAHHEGHVRACARCTRPRNRMHESTAPPPDRIHSHTAASRGAGAKLPEASTELVSRGSPCLRQPYARIPKRTRANHNSIQIHTSKRNISARGCITTLWSLYCNVFFMECALPSHTFRPRRRMILSSSPLGQGVAQLLHGRRFDQSPRRLRINSHLLPEHALRLRRARRLA